MSRPLPSRRLPALLLLALAAGPAAGRELSWPALEVEARLESDGTLAISELQRMRFSGDWNGGERRFRLALGQRLTLDRVVRLAGPDGPERELVRGDLAVVDHWDWTSSDTVRWRSRLPSDPPFDSTELAYRLDYRLTGALVREGERRYRLAHDFAFAERDGTIERLRVRLTLAPPWRALTPLADLIEAGPLVPGESYVVRVELAFDGAAEPALAAPARLAGLVVAAIAVALLLGWAVLVARFRARERALGRFAPLPEVSGPGWLEEKVFALAPELVGAAWDRTIAAPEVAAMLARLTQEGKLASAVESRGRWLRAHDLKLRCLVAREAFSEPERRLIDALFGEASETDTRALRERYRGTGFDPASRIRAGLESGLARLRGFAADSPRPARLPTAQLLLAGLTLLGVVAIGFPASRLPALLLLPVLLVASLPGLVGALVGQSRVGRLVGPAVALAVTFFLQLAVIVGCARWPGVSLAAPLGGALLALGIDRFLLNLLATRESAVSLERRRELAAARRYFAGELARREPRLEDRWFPYLLAFGLAPQMDRWFRAFGGAARAGGGSTWTSTGSPTGGGGWSGGGGAFGGAGASATWAMAATAMSAGVPAPSSSGGGGGGGGSSSGGGGGGGW